MPEDYRTVPPAQLVGQILEGIRYEPDSSNIWEMFERLMGRGYDARRGDNAHPAFVGIIKQLSPDEAKLIQIIANKILIVPYLYQKSDRSQSVGPLELAEALRDINLHKPEYAIVYLEHLYALGLIAPLIGKPDEIVQYGVHAGFQRFVFESHANGFGKMFYDATNKKA